MTLEAQQAADVLGRHGCEVDLIDLRVLSPLRTELVAESVARTGRLVVIDTGYTDFGIGAEICSRVTESCWGLLKEPPRRMGLGPHPTPSSTSLAEAYYPRSPQIAEVVGRMVGLSGVELSAARAELTTLRDRLPCDIPHPAFKGPF
jgi:pyruvate dehydrogenase E1 component beta subunit